LKAGSRSILLFHAGLGAFSLPPALLLFLLLNSILPGSLPAMAAAAAVILTFQIIAVAWRKGLCDWGLPLKLSFWTLKILQAVRLLPEYGPEKTVVELSNIKMLERSGEDFSAGSTLILLPHCLQNHQCPIRLTYDPGGCERCGKCPIGPIMDIADRFGVHVAIASGGTSARRIVERIAPKLILAVACPVDLSLGIMDVQPITTVGVLNSWPSGPCFDTWVAAEELEDILKRFLEPLDR
jgi:uncharacterized protein